MPEEVRDQAAQDLSPEPSPDELGAEVVIEEPEVGGGDEPQQREEPGQKQTRYQTRIDELTKKFREEERRRVALEDEVRTIRQQQMQQPQYQQPNPQQAIAQLKAQKRAHLAALEFDKADDVDERIRSVEKAIDEQRLLYQISTINQQRDIQATTTRFVKETPWYDQGSGEFNEPMAVYANYLAQQKASQLGRRTADDLMTEIRRETEEKFNYKRATTKQPVSFVGGVKGEGMPSQKVVTLSADQRKVARMMFPDDPDAEKKYARGLAGIEGGQNG